ncbi:MAG: hypothetical protein Q4E60_10680 [Bacteroidales bacterium]|nr:hypothetical protein [Bacteroidales bacterium]
MKIKFLTFIACFAIVATSLVGCKDDDIPEKGSEPGFGITEPDERLTGVWLLKSALNPETNKLEPVELEESAIFVASIQDHEAIYHSIPDFINNELAFYADADSLVIIDVNIIGDMEESIKNAGIEEFDFTQVSPADGNAPWFSKFKYEIVDNDSLVLYWRDPETSKVYYGGYSRMKDVEEAPSAETRGFLSWVKDKFTTGIKKVTDYIGEKVDQLCHSIISSAPAWVKKAIEIGLEINDLSPLNISAHNFNPPHPNTKNWEKSKWISMLADDNCVGQLCIPGAHDACTGTISVLGAMTGVAGIAVNADCQNLTIPELLNAGVRYLDIRTRSSLHDFGKVRVSLPNFNIFTPQIDLSPTRKKEEAWTYHGPIDCGISLEKVFTQAEDFLKEHKDEFVVMRVSSEGNQALDIPNEKATAVRLYHETERNHKDHILAYRPDMKLSEARGKILIINDDFPAEGTEKIGSYTKEEGKENPNYLSHLENTGTGDGKCKWYYQNIYEMLTFDKDKMKSKLDGIAELAVVAKNYYNEHGFTMAFNNQLNANTGIAAALKCYYFARVFNQATYNMFIKDMEEKTGMFVGGLYSMDYAGVENYMRITHPAAVWGESMVWAIIENNFQRLKTKE